MILNDEIKRRFIKDYNLPISTVEEPLFTHNINELDTFLNTKEKLNNLIYIVKELGSEDAFFKESSKIINSIIDSIQRKNAYKTLSDDRLNEKSQIQNIPHKDIYNLINVGKDFISIDLVKANFQALKNYSKELVLNSNSYDELISKFTEYDYFKQSKQIRQVIFGNLLPKKQQILQKEMMNNIFQILIEAKIPIEKFTNASADEIIIQTKDRNENIEYFNKIIELKEKGLFPDIRLEQFKLNNIGDRKFFVKEFYNDTVEFKGIPSYYYIQAYKKYFDLELKENDLKFLYEGSIATFEKPLFEQKELSINENQID